MVRLVKYLGFPSCPFVSFVVRKLSPRRRPPDRIQRFEGRETVASQGFIRQVDVAQVLVAFLGVQAAVGQVVGHGPEVPQRQVVLVGQHGGFQVETVVAFAVVGLGRKDRHHALVQQPLDDLAHVGFVAGLPVRADRDQRERRLAQAQFAIQRGLARPAAELALVPLGPQQRPGGRPALGGRAFAVERTAEKINRLLQVGRQGGVLLGVHHVQAQEGIRRALAVAQDRESARVIAQRQAPGVDGPHILGHNRDNRPTHPGGGIQAGRDGQDIRGRAGSGADGRFRFERRGTGGLLLGGRDFRGDGPGLGRRDSCRRGG